MHMNLKDIKNQIVEELNDAVHYITMAEEEKGTECGSLLHMISKNELEHANILLKIFNKIEKPEIVTDAEYAAMHKEILESYTEIMPKYEAIKKLYMTH